MEDCAQIRADLPIAHPVLTADRIHPEAARAFAPAEGGSNVAEIEVDSDAYDGIIRLLSQAADQLRSTEPVSSAVPGMAFGPMLAFVPPALNAVGSAAQAAAKAAGGISERTGDGISRAVDGFQSVDDRASADLKRIG